MIDIRVPKLNNNDSSYLLVEWTVEDRSPVLEGDPIAVVETSKAAEELVAEASGVLHHVIAVNAECAPGQVIARLSAPDAAAGPAPSPTAEPDGVALVPEPAEPSPATPAASTTPAAPVGGEPVITAPARALMAELGVDAEDVRALGTRVIRRADVLAVARDTIALTKAQRRTAEVVELSHRTVPAAYSVVRVEVTRALRLAAERTRALRALVGLPELLVKAAASLVERFPLCFATPLDAARVRRAGTADIGVTMDVGEGLYVPVVHDAGNRPLGEIARELMGYRTAAFRGTFRERDLTGANLTVTLHNDDGVVLAVPIVFPGQICALSLAGPYREAVVADDGQVGTRDVVNLGLAYDHRYVNGRDAVLFLQALRELLESPDVMT
ncbi:2-oxo acid dehydrogenase subunit E2 [Sphaerimonospora mesophila]|uniref:2-oxo acid dehydrogenase subunit E2 n=1 Tax=Sphaerimonospora mesophila TaxID=37483 RepID=UPI0006E29925